ncbi:MAG: aminodeoxychorismate synthase, component I [Pirellulaceae bacterium]|nr:MAG: aminodeoxychorismate synthase, component I [Pirellulaceae bacterium]
MKLPLNTSANHEDDVAPRSLPLVRPLPAAWTPEYCFRRLCRRPGCVWLDSSLPSTAASRYSYLSASPIAIVRIDSEQNDALVFPRQLLRRFQQPLISDLPPMQGGWMGWFGYEFGRCFEKLPEVRYNEFSLPLAELGFYDVVLAWDHQVGQGWLISQGLPHVDPIDRARQAYARLQQFEGWLKEPSMEPSHGAPAGTVARTVLSPQYATRHAEWTSNFSPQAYRQAVARCVDYIHAGDVFQVNLSQRLLTRARCAPSDLYLHLRQLNPAPFSGYVDFGRIQVLSTSPERFLHVRQGRVETHPIKGTRPRLSDPLADSAMGKMLQESEKDRAENVMIVDLLRNDLSKVAIPRSVAVPQLCRLERYPYVWHLVSTVTAELAPPHDACDLIAAAFPGGSITGAPKIRAMEIITELEQVVRGPYCGALGYFNLAGDLDTNILIRTVTSCEGWWSLSVGGGIVVDSQPAAEEQETWHKAEGVIRAIDKLPG